MAEFDEDGDEIGEERLCKHGVPLGPLVPCDECIREACARSASKPSWPEQRKKCQELFVKISDTIGWEPTPKEMKLLKICREALEYIDELSGVKKNKAQKP